MRMVLCALMLWLSALLCVSASAQQASPGRPLPHQALNVGYDFAQDSLAKALAKDSLFIGKSFRGKVNEAALRKLIAQSPPDRPLKIVLAEGYPKSAKFFGNQWAYLFALHQHFNLKRGYLLKVASKGTLGVTNALTPGLIAHALTPLQSQMTSDPTTGVRKAVAALDQLEEKYKHQPLPTPAITWDKPPHFDDPLPPMPKRPPLFLFLWIPICTGTGCLVALIVVTARQRAYQRVLTSARLPVLRLQEEVASGLVYADTHLNDLPDSPDAKAARQARQIAATLLDQANLQANKVKTQGDLERVQAVLELAKEKTDLCRQRIDAVKESG